MESTQQITNSSIGTRLSRSKGRLARVHVAQARVTQPERQELEAAARRESKALSEWARDVLLHQARRSQDDALFTELVAHADAAREPYQAAHPWRESLARVDYRGHDDGAEREA